MLESHRVAMRGSVTVGNSRHAVSSLKWAVLCTTAGDEPEFWTMIFNTFPKAPCSFMVYT